MSRAVPFPATKRTWLAERIGGGDEHFAEVRSHVMRVYFAPLVAYASRSKFRGPLEPEESVNTFFLGRFGDRRYLEGWVKSGLPLRRWLAGGLVYALRQSLRDEAQRNNVIEAGLEGDTDHVAAVEPGPYAALCERYRSELVARAIEQADKACADRGLSAHWRAFLALRRDGASVSDVAGHFGVSHAKLAVLARTGQRQFRAAVRRAIQLEGVPAGRVDAVIKDLLDR